MATALGQRRKSRIGSPAPGPSPTGKNVQVVCRIRPQRAEEMEGQEPLEWLNVDSSDVHIRNIGRDVDFEFECVHGQEARQIDVFNSVSFVVEAVMQGYNGSLMAYGQTSSGKTHSMEGRLKDAEEMGIMPRAFDLIFNTIRDAGTEETYEVKTSYVEIYCEIIRDLLGKGNDNLRLIEGPGSGVSVEHVTEVMVKGQSDVMQLLKEGQGNRAKAATKMNQGSSRSHSVLLTTVTATHTTTLVKRSAKLMLVDLAGSERVSKTLISGGQRLKEAQNINKSLTFLGTCIKALADGAAYIPYRDSKLTRMIQEALGGNSRTSLIICCAPELRHAPETVSTLRFGQRARLIKNKATLNQDMAGADLKVLLAKAQGEIERLRGLLRAFEEAGTPLPVSIDPSLLSPLSPKDADEEDEDQDEIDERMLVKQALVRTLRQTGRMMPLDDDDGELDGVDESADAMMRGTSRGFMLGDIVEEAETPRRDDLQAVTPAPLLSHTTRALNHLETEMSKASQAFDVMKAELTASKAAEAQAVEKLHAVEEENKKLAQQVKWTKDVETNLNAQVEASLAAMRTQKEAHSTQLNELKEALEVKKAEAQAASQLAKQVEGDLHNQLKASNDALAAIGEAAGVSSDVLSGAAPGGKRSGPKMVTDAVKSQMEGLKKERHEVLGQLQAMQADMQVIRAAMGRPAQLSQQPTDELCQGQLDALKAGLAVLLTEVQSREAAINAARDDLSARLRTSQEVLIQQLNTNQTAQDSIHSLTSRVEALQSDLNSKEKELAEALSRATDQGESTDAARARIEQLMSELRSQTEATQTLEQALKVKDEELAAVQEAVGMGLEAMGLTSSKRGLARAVKTQVEKLKAEVDAARARMEELGGEKREMQEAMQVSAIQMQHSRDQVQQLQSEVAGLKAHVQAKEEELDRTVTSHERALKTANELLAQVDELRQQVQEQTGMCEALKEQIQAKDDEFVAARNLAAERKTLLDNACVEVEGLKTTLDAMQRQVKKHEQSEAEAAAQLRATQEALTQQTNLYQSAQDTISSLNDRVTALQQDMTVKEKELAQALARVTDQDSSNGAAQAHIEQLMSDLRAQTEEVQSLQQCLKVREDELAAVQDILGMDSQAMGLTTSKRGLARAVKKMLDGVHAEVQRVEGELQALEEESREAIAERQENADLLRKARQATAEIKAAHAYVQQEVIKRETHIHKLEDQVHTLQEELGKAENRARTAEAERNVLVDRFRDGSAVSPVKSRFQPASGEVKQQQQQQPKGELARYMQAKAQQAEGGEGMSSTRGEEAARLMQTQLQDLQSGIEELRQSLRAAAATHP